MRNWPNDNAHCDRANCPKALQCVRHLALISKRRAGLSDCVVVNDFNPVDCSDYVETIAIQASRIRLD